MGRVSKRKIANAQFRFLLISRGGLGVILNVGSFEYELLSHDFGRRLCARFTATEWLRPAVRAGFPLCGLAKHKLRRLRLPKGRRHEGSYVAGNETKKGNEFLFT